MDGFDAETRGQLLVLSLLVVRRRMLVYDVSESWLAVALVVSRSRIIGLRSG